MATINYKYSKSKLKYSYLDSLSYTVVKRNIDKKNKILFDLYELCLLSRIHIKESKLMRIDLEVASDEMGPFIKVEQDMDIVSGQVKIIKVGSLPCRYFRITVKKGGPLLLAANLECYGFHINDIKNKYDEDTLDLLFYNTYDLIYRKYSDR